MKRLLLLGPLLLSACGKPRPPLPPPSGPVWEALKLIPRSRGVDEVYVFDYQAFQRNASAWKRSPERWRLELVQREIIGKLGIPDVVVDRVVVDDRRETMGHPSPVVLVRATLSAAELDGVLAKAGLSVDKSRREPVWRGNAGTFYVFDGWLAAVSSDADVELLDFREGKVKSLADDAEIAELMKHCPAMPVVCVSTSPRWLPNDNDLGLEWIDPATLNQTIIEMKRGRKAEEPHFETTRPGPMHPARNAEGAFSDLDRIHGAFQQYVLSYDYPPPTEGGMDLAKVLPELRTDPWGTPYRYVRSDKYRSWTLICAGPDRTFDTADDIIKK